MTDISFIDKAIKDALLRELKDNFGRYMKLLQQWFKHQLSKEDFDAQAKSLFPNADVATHNRFILNIMSTCQIVDAPNKAKETTHLSKSLQHRFKEVPQMPLIALISEYQMAHASQTEFNHGRKDFSVVTTSCTREQRLPGSWMLYGRLMNTLQLYSLQEFSPEALNCLAEATQRLARRVLLSALASRRCCRLVPAASPGGGAQPASDESPSPSPCGPPSPRRLERVSFGRVPIVPLSLGDAFVAAVPGERLNAYLQFSTARRAPPLADAAAAAAAAAASCEVTEAAAVEERLRVDALLRRGVSQRPAAAAAVQLGLDDLHRVLTRPDSHLVGYHCLQRRDQPVASHFLRFLSQSRVIHRLSQRQLRDLRTGQLREEDNAMMERLG